MLEQDPVELIATGDGSFTVRGRSWNACYHSQHGALTESRHVFIRHGLDACPRPRIHVLEVGFGTGLNALLTLEQALKRSLRIRYTALEPNPLPEAVIQQLAYGMLMTEPDRAEGFLCAMHRGDRGRLPGCFEFELLHQRVQELPLMEPVDVVYFDAFAPSTQPEMWSADIFRILYSALVPGGHLVTFCSKGQVRRDLQAIGFEVERLPGPPGKREMLRARRPGE
ncbi:MAG: tRNA (5-methylaminomethyl-2-thiouridine)(34)-methyltransferase MnmD [Flavobacteriales bacterium]|nr:tRNA (5-methylaminomethyl-2-thiouridine)(34)-methyltransferase MnmD [Flavobacteriales bacterium]